MKKFLVVIVLVFCVGAGIYAASTGADLKQEPASSSAPVKKTDTAEDFLKDMTLKEKVGQMFFVCASKDSIRKEDISHYGLGGYVFFADFFKDQNPDKVTMQINAYQKVSKIPLLTGVDEEGGSVVRVSQYRAYRKAAFASPREVYKRDGLTGIKKDTEEKSKLLLDMGINVNLAPVCDVSTEKDDFIYDRSFGKSAEETAEYVSTYVKTASSAGIGTVLKHFPGYGNNVDTHTGIAIDKRKYATFEKEDFFPFQVGIAAGADCVLVSHNVVNCMDKKHPASLSKNVHKVLRNKLNFDKVIMTDDLSMDAIADYAKDRNVAVAAVKAGNDLLCTSSYKQGIPSVIKAVQDGEISEKQIDQSVTRILNWKIDLGLIQE